MAKELLLLLVADGASARLFESVGRSGKLRPVWEESNPHGREKTSEMTSDLPGRTFDSSGEGGRHAIEPTTDPKDVERRRFAGRIATRLEHADLTHCRLLLVAPPHFLGELRDALPTAVHRHVITELNKELTHLSVPQLERHLVAELMA